MVSAVLKETKEERDHVCMHAMYAARIVATTSQTDRLRSLPGGAKHPTTRPTPPPSHHPTPNNQQSAPRIDAAEMGQYQGQVVRVVGRVESNQHPVALLGCGVRKERGPLGVCVCMGQFHTMQARIRSREPSFFVSHPTPIDQPTDADRRPPRRACR